MYTHFNTYAAKYLTDVKIYEENLTLTADKNKQQHVFCLLLHPRGTP